LTNDILAGLILGLISCASLAAPCPPREMIPPAQVRIAGESLMIVTHATSFHDARFSTKRGVDEAVRFAKQKGIPVIYLQDGSPDQFYFMEDCQPDFWVASDGGEIGFEVPASHLYIVGGHLELCLAKTVNDVLEQWARQPVRDRSITYFMDGIYTNGRLVESSDPFYADFQKFMAVIMYGRPHGEHWPKLSLLENMGVIVKEEHEFDYLKRALPQYMRTLPEGYQVELKLDDSVVKVLRPAAGWWPPAFRFHFVDSALDAPRW
jgi:hypothetical protein